MLTNTKLHTYEKVCSKEQKSYMLTTASIDKPTCLPKAAICINDIASTTVINKPDLSIVMLHLCSWWSEFSGQTLTEFWWHILSSCQVCDWGIQYHPCSIYRGLWGLVVVQLSWLSGRALAAQARGVLGSTPSDCRLFHFLYFHLITSK